MPAGGPGHWLRMIEMAFPRITAFSGYGVEDLGATAAPTLILVGDRDPFCSVELGATVSRALPDGELAVLPGTGHLITPGATAATIEFLERRLGSG